MKINIRNEFLNEIETVRIYYDGYNYGQRCLDPLEFLPYYIYVLIPDKYAKDFYEYDRTF